MDFKLNKKQLQALDLIEPDEELFKKYWATEGERISDNLKLRILLDENNRYHINIEIKHETGIEELEQNWHKILSARETLERAQGKDFPLYFNEVLRQIYEMDYENFKFTYLGFLGQILKSKPSLRKLLMDANFDALVFLICTSMPTCDDDTKDFAQHLFSTLLLAFNFTEKEIAEIQSEALELLSKGKCPWDITNSPIAYPKFREKMRYLFDQNPQREFKHSVEDKGKLLKILQLFLINKSWLKSGRNIKKVILYYKP